MTTTPTHNDIPLREPGRDAVLDQLLDEELRHDPVARNGFISHLAMSLVAARRLGATDVELREWYTAQVDDGYLVERDLPTWLEPDVAELTALGTESVVRRELPGLIEAPLSQFFHAVIRLELALDAGHAGQVANALRNMRSHGHPLPDPPGGAGGESFASVVAALRKHPARRSGSMGELRTVAGQPWFSGTLDRLRYDDALLDDIASFTIGSHLAEGDFATLHLVTGTRAVRALVPLLGTGDRARLSLRTAQAVAAVAVVLLHGSGPVAERPATGTTRGWGEIGRAAIATHDPHVVKLAYAAQLEEAATGDRRYRSAAARHAGLGI
jgi:hypothetical protein